MLSFLVSNSSSLKTFIFLTLFSPGYFLLSETRGGGAMKAPPSLTLKPLMVGTPKLQRITGFQCHAIQNRSKNKNQNRSIDSL